MWRIFSLDKYQLSLLLFIWQKNKSNNTVVSLRGGINGTINVIYYDSKDVVPSDLRSISQKYFSTLSHLHVPVEKHDNIMYGNIQREIIEFERYVSIETQETDSDWNDEFWDSI